MCHIRPCSRFSRLTEHTLSYVEVMSVTCQVKGFQDTLVPVHVVKTTSFKALSKRRHF
ncbi:hypothetical protein HN51_028754 [Arachis hypogaea]